MINKFDINFTVFEESFFIPNKIFSTPGETRLDRWQSEQNGLQSNVQYAIICDCSAMKADAKRIRSYFLGPSSITVKLF